MVISPNDGRFHPVVSILAVSNGVPWQSLHEVHLPHAATWILDEPVFRLELPYKLMDVLVHFVAFLRVFADRSKVAAILAPSVV